MFKKLALVTMSLVLILSVAACGGGTTPSTTPSASPKASSPVASPKASPSASPTAAAKEITLGAVLELTGQLSGMGPSLKNGVALAVKQINDAGGINGAKVNLIVEDGKTDPTAGLEATKKLVEVNGVKYIVGPMISGTTVAVGPYALQKGVLMVSPSATAPTINNQDWRKFVYRTAPSDTLQGAAMAQLVVEGGYKKVVIFAMDNQYGAGIADVVTAALEGKAEILNTIKYDPAKLDYNTELQIIKDKAPDCVVHIGYGDDARVIYKQALSYGLDKMQWIAPEGVYGESTFNEASAAKFMASSVIGTRLAAPEGNDANAKFIADYKAEFKTDPGVYADSAYDAAMLILKAMKNVGADDSTKVAAEVLKIAKNYPGASGSITFDAVGDRTSGSFEVWKVVLDADNKPSYQRVKIIDL